MSAPRGVAGWVGRLNLFIGRAFRGAKMDLGGLGVILKQIRNTSSIYWLYVRIYLILIMLYCLLFCILFYH